MSLIDWADPEEMFGLLIDYVAGEHSETEDSTRRAFLSRLKNRLEALQYSFEALPLVEAIHELRRVRLSIADEFESDSVVEHVSACIEELERVHATAV